VRSSRAPKIELLARRRDAIIFNGDSHRSAHRADEACLLRRLDGGDRVALVTALDLVGRHEARCRASTRRRESKSFRPSAPPPAPRSCARGGHGPNTFLRGPRRCLRCCRPSHSGSLGPYFTGGVRVPKGDASLSFERLKGPLVRLVAAFTDGYRRLRLPIAHARPLPGDERTFRRSNERDGIALRYSDAAGKVTAQRTRMARSTTSQHLRGPSQKRVPVSCPTPSA